MPNDNALLPPTIHLGYLPDDRVIAHLRRARESIRFVGPGLSVVVARTLTERWNEMGPGAVEVVLDPDADLCRLGFCDGEALTLLLKAAEGLDRTVRRQSGVRLCVLEIDDERIIFAPTPRLVEEPGAAAPEILLAPSQGESLHDQILAAQAPRPLTQAFVQKVTADLQTSPAQPFDLARQIRVLSTKFQFVEFHLEKAGLSRKGSPFPRIYSASARIQMPRNSCARVSSWLGRAMKSPARSFGSVAMPSRRSIWLQSRTTEM